MPIQSGAFVPSPCPNYRARAGMGGIGRSTDMCVDLHKRLHKTVGAAAAARPSKLAMPVRSRSPCSRECPAQPTCADLDEGLHRSREPPAFRRSRAVRGRTIGDRYARPTHRRQDVRQGAPRHRNQRSSILKKQSPRLWPGEDQRRVPTGERGHTRPSGLGSDDDVRHSASKAEVGPVLGSHVDETCC